MDNIFIERLWRSIKYEEVHLKAYTDGHEARSGIGRWMDFYNHCRPHQALSNQRPMNLKAAVGSEFSFRLRAASIPGCVSLVSDAEERARDGL